MRPLAVFDIHLDPELRAGFAPFGFEEAEGAGSDPSEGVGRQR